MGIGNWVGLAVLVIVLFAIMVVLLWPHLRHGKWD